MEKRSVIQENELFNSQISFKPLIKALKHSIESGKPGASGLYGKLVAELEKNPVFMNPVIDPNVIEDNRELIDELLATVFPASLSDSDNLYAVGRPFHNDIIYASSKFRQVFMKPGTNEVQIPNEKIQQNLEREKIQFAYNLVLKKFLQVPMPSAAVSIQSFGHELEMHHSVNIDASFIDVHSISPEWQLPNNVICTKTNQIMSIDRLMTEVPLSNFQFEGLSIIR